MPSKHKYPGATMKLFANNIDQLDGYLSLDVSGAVIAESTEVVSPTVRLPSDGTSLCREGGTWTKTGTGEYTLTLAGSFARLEHASVDMTFNSTVANLSAVVGPNTVKYGVAQGSQTIKVFIVANNATKTNPSAPCGIFYSFKFLRSG